MDIFFFFFFFAKVQLCYFVTLLLIGFSLAIYLYGLLFWLYGRRVSIGRAAGGGSCDFFFACFAFRKSTCIKIKIKSIQQKKTRY